MVQFCKLGKSVNDLFKKKYDFSNSISTKNSSNNVTVEAGGVRGSGAMAGYTKGTYRDSKYGELEVTIKSDNKGDNTCGQLKLNQMGDGLEVTIKGSVSKVCVEGVYSKDFATVTGAVSTDFANKTGLTASGVISNDGLAVGGAVALDVNSGDLSDYNVGTEYKTKDFTTTLVTSNKGEDITASYFQTVNGTMLGARFTLKPENNTRNFCFGTQYNLDSKTLVKAKATSDGMVSTVVEHRLASPNCLLGVSSSFNALASGADILKTQACGIQLKFGEQ